MSLQKYSPPMFDADAFHCPLCQVYAQQHWFRILTWERSETPFKGCRCAHCKEAIYWHVKKHTDENFPDEDHVEGELLIPRVATAPLPHEEMPEECKEDYTEARDIADRSPKAAAALLRLCLQKLLSHLGGKGKNINDDIAELVRQGLPTRVRDALDFCRVIGNNAVHPGEIDLGDKPDVVNALFDMINFVVDERIARPKQQAELFARTMPKGALDAIERRDSLV